ncbi:MAG: hypothetical protein H6606_06685 [Flavobacteriales bacterium]|nr:hypothetical protein [Flavobacteriales bacterium]
MKRNLHLGLILIGFSTLFTACNPDDPDPIPQPEYPVKVELSHVFGAQPLSLNGPFYITENGDSFQLTKLIYHINNFEFLDASGNVVHKDNRYFMVDLSKEENPMFEFANDLTDVHKVRFTIGVADSATNYDGTLNSQFTDPMYWGMISGYINFKLEGNSPSVSNDAVVLHIGGYTEPFKNSRVIEVDLSTAASSQLGKNTIGVELDLSKYFYSPNTIDLAIVNLIHSPSDEAAKIADNWLDMFSFTGLK